MQAVKTAPKPEKWRKIARGKIVAQEAGEAGIPALVLLVLVWW
ncbi:hypothetical protein [Acetobacter sacchari]|nr:hypothetical protein [Acetobacter sacchari]